MNNMFLMISIFTILLSSIYIIPTVALQPIFPDQLGETDWRIDSLSGHVKQALHSVSTCTTYVLYDNIPIIYIYKFHFNIYIRNIYIIYIVYIYYRKVIHLYLHLMLNLLD